MTIKIAIAGVGGRMGQALVTAGIADARFQIVGGTEKEGSDLIGSDIGLVVGKIPLGCQICSSVIDAAARADVWIDFTSTGAAISALAALSQTKVQVVIIGTTGFNYDQQGMIEETAQRVAIVQSGNFSIGVNLVAGLVRQAAARLGPDWDIEVIESHHRHKVDAPSGTALMLGHAAAHGRGVAHDEVASFARHGHTGARAPGDIGYAVIRAGGIIGEHEVMFAADDEIVTLTHKASSRTIFAKGALAAAAWAHGKLPGLYSMDDVLAL